LFVRLLSGFSNAQSCFPGIINVLNLFRYPWVEPELEDMNDTIGHLFPHHGGPAAATVRRVSSQRA
jgi:hypothetical protein